MPGTRTTTTYTVGNADHRSAQPTPSEGGFEILVRNGVRVEDFQFGRGHYELSAPREGGVSPNGRPAGVKAARRGHLIVGVLLVPATRAGVTARNLAVRILPTLAGLPAAGTETDSQTMCGT